jgi:hypothetical protein
MHEQIDMSPGSVERLDQEEIVLLVASIRLIVHKQ